MVQHTVWLWAEWDFDMSAPEGLLNSCSCGGFEHPNSSSAPQRSRVTMKYLAVLSSTACEVLFTTSRRPIVACLFSHNMNYVMSPLSVGKPRHVSHRERPIHAGAKAAERFLLLRNCWESHWMHDENHKVVLNAYPCISCSLIKKEQILTSWLHKAINAYSVIPADTMSRLT